MIVEGAVELKDHRRLLIVRWWLTLALLETGLILAGVLSLVSGSALRDRNPTPGTGIATVGIILQHEFIFRERDDSVIPITFRRSPYFNVIAASHIPFLLDRESFPGAIGPTSDAPPVAFEHDGFTVSFPSSYQFLIHFSITGHRCGG